MSINSAMLAGVTVLTAIASALAATSDNIANVNTVGYKRNVTEFSDLVTAASSNNYSAGGVQAITTAYVTQQGLLQSTSSPTDLAISGQGFFVTTATPTNVSATSPRLFTRAGSFTVDSQGYLKNAAGLYLQGWLADANGTITTDPSNINLLQPINVATAGGAAGATTTAQVNANLNADARPSPAASTRTPPMSPTAVIRTPAVANTTAGGCLRTNRRRRLRPRPPPPPAWPPTIRPPTRAPSRTSPSRCPWPTPRAARAACRSTS